MTADELSKRQRARIATIDESIALAEKVVAQCHAAKFHTDAITYEDDPVAEAARAGAINGAAAVLIELRALRRRAEAQVEAIEQVATREAPPASAEVAA